MLSTQSLTSAQARVVVTVVDALDVAVVDMVSLGVVTGVVEAEDVTEDVAVCVFDEVPVDVRVVVVVCVVVGDEVSVAVPVVESVEVTVDVTVLVGV